MTEHPVTASELETLRPELTRFCYRMLGSIFDADDAVQDTLLRAWEHWEEFRGGSRRAWVHRIATNVCLDKLRAAGRRALPMDLNGPTEPVSVPVETLPLDRWVWPAHDEILGSPTDPAESAVYRDTIRLAFVAALQILPGRQRAVLILRDVFRWSAAETAAIMGTSTAAVNSALQRARATIDRERPTDDGALKPNTSSDLQLLDRYVNAFLRMDIPALVALFEQDGSLSMPPFPMWIRGRDNLRAFYHATAFHCRGSRLLPLTVNGVPAFAQYSPNEDGTRLEPWGIHVPEARGEFLTHVHTFIDPRLYARFGLPTTLPLAGPPVVEGA